MSDYAVYGNIDLITGKPTFVGTQKECEDALIRDKIIFNIRESYDTIKNELGIYLDMKKEYYTLVSLWIIGTYIHHEFDSFPYLFFNAMRGSGKSRALKLICELSKDGNVMASPTEAVLFRTNGTLGIDEFEGVAGRDKSSIRELLNGAYKKGIKIMRMKKKKVLGQEEQVVEEFEPYRPVVMSNIYGMDEVLGDRCLTLILEKSSNPITTRITEDFKNNIYIQKVRTILNQCSLCSVVMSKNIYTEWNNYIFNRYKTTLTTYNTYNTQYTQTTPNIKLTSLFNKIHDSGIIGRNLELFLPLFFIAELIDTEVLNEIIKIAEESTAIKKHEEEMESLDVMVYDFISKQEQGFVWFSVKELINRFKDFSDFGNEDWLNAKWFGRALKRLNLVLEKKRVGHGVEVILNVPKATEKLKMFKIYESKDKEEKKC